MIIGRINIDSWRTQLLDRWFNSMVENHGFTLVNPGLYRRRRYPSVMYIVDMY